MIPRLAVVGHPNKGKSSIVATLTEHDDIRIAPLPGTTERAEHFTLEVDGEPLYQLIDTPGFQRAGQMLAWLEAQPTDASQRRAAIEAFLEAHADDDKFTDEKELLAPILAGAGILYVVDGSKPWGEEYQKEMEILRWTGQPRMALINMIGSTDFRDTWRQGLDQYFSLVREFNPMEASFDARLGLLRAFGELEEGWYPQMQRAQAALLSAREQQMRRTAAVIADLLVDSLSASRDAPLAEDGNADSVKAALLPRLLSDLRRREKRARKSVEAIYHHHDLEFEQSQFELVDADLFEEETWQLFGLSKTQLLATGAITGAVAGGSIDLLVGGASLLAGTVLGGSIGSLVAWFGGDEMAKVKVLGNPLGGSLVRIGPIESPNFPWVLLGRAVLHHQLIAERNHAVRTKLVATIDTEAAHAGAIDVANLATTDRIALERMFARIKSDREVDKVELAELIEGLLSSRWGHGEDQDT